MAATGAREEGLGWLYLAEPAFDFWADAAENMHNTVNLVVKISPEMRRQARAIAAMGGETISEVVRAAMAKYIQDSLAEMEDVGETDAILA